MGTAETSEVLSEILCQRLYYVQLLMWMFLEMFGALYYNIII